MTTVKHLERLWETQKHDRLLTELFSGRIEQSATAGVRLSSQIAAAAMIVIRLDELCQSECDLSQRMIRFLIEAQGADGGWIDPANTSIVLRALMNGRGAGTVIERGLTALANLQKDDGLWPAEPIRRMTGDEHITAFILLQLGQQPRFRDAVQFDNAVRWLGANAESLDVPAQKLWRSAELRCKRIRSIDRQPVWS